MNAQREAHVACGGEDGTEPPAAVGRRGAHDHEQLHKPWVATGAANLGCGRLGIFRVNNDRAAPPRVMVQPARGRHLVHRPRERVGEIEVLYG